MLVSETDKFPTSKATTLESSNKSLSKPSQSSASSSGKQEIHSRPRRSLDGHASLNSSVSSLNFVSSTDSSYVDVHENTTPLTTVSLVHSVSTKPSTEQTGSVNAYNASMSTYGETINTGVLTNNNTTLEIKTPTISSESNSTIKSQENVRAILNKNLRTKSKETNIDYPREISFNKKDDIAYEPSYMQSDSSSVYSYGLQKLQYLKLLTRLNEVSEELHIYSNDLTERDSSLEKFHYESEHTTLPNTERNVYKTANSFNLSPNTPKVKSVLTESTPVFTTHKPNFVTDNEVLNELKTIEALPKTSHITKLPSMESAIMFTTHKPNQINEHVLSITEPSPSVTNYTDTMNTTSTPISLKTESEPSTLNIASESKTQDTMSNAKHVLINLTISADDANDSYKPLYSLTVTVPTVGEANEIPTVKITPMSSEPTMPTNFNKPVTIDSITKTIKTVNTENWGGSCECACPSCEDVNNSESLYDDYTDRTTTVSKEASTKVTDYSTIELTTASNENYFFENSSITQTESTIDVTTDVTRQSDSYETSTVNELITSTSDEVTSTETTESSSEPDRFTTDLPKCVCPKVKPPPILILEGEVSKFCVQIIY